MDIERAIEILNPEHREHYDSIETVNEACRMGMEALRELREAQEGDFISRDAAISWLEDMQCKHPRKADAFGAAKVHFKRLPAADVVEVHAVIDHMNEERKRAKGNWHTDPYWLGWVDAMSRAQRIVDGTIDNEPMYAPSNGEKREDK